MNRYCTDATNISISAGYNQLREAREGKHDASSPEPATKGGGVTIISSLGVITSQ